MRHVAFLVDEPRVHEFHHRAANTRVHVQQVHRPGLLLVGGMSKHSLEDRRSSGEDGAVAVDQSIPTTDSKLDR